MLCGFHRVESSERVLVLFRGGSLFASDGVPSATGLLNIEVIVSVRSVVSGLVHLHGRSPLLAVRRSLFILIKVYHTGMEKSTLFLHLFFIIESSELSDNSIGRPQRDAIDVPLHRGSAPSIQGGRRVCADCAILGVFALLTY